MKIELKDVKSKSCVVGQAEYEVFDSIGEAEDHCGTAVTLDLINRQRRTDKLNEIRQTVTGKPSKEALKYLVMSELTAADFAEVQGDPEALKILVDRKIKEKEASLAAAVSVQPKAEDGDDLDEE